MATSRTPDQCLMLLNAKGGTQRWQPVSPALMQHLLAHAQERGAPPGYRDGCTCRYRRCDHL